MLKEIPPEMLDKALGVVLAPPGASRASRAAVRSFREYLAATDVAWEGVYDPALGLESGVLAIRLPGRSAVAVLPGGESAVYSDALQAFAARLRASDLAFVQALVEPGERAKGAALERAAFCRITQLIYLERDPTYPWTDPPDSRANWIPYSPGVHARYRAAIERTYIGSADCPELTVLRTTDDAIASHGVAGASGTALWELLSIDDCDAGVLLLSVIGGERAVEVSYMGLVPEMRGRGLGGLLLRRALERARMRRARLVTIVVDERNARARGLYEHLGFRAVTTRDAYLLTCQSDTPRRAGSCG